MELAINSAKPLTQVYWGALKNLGQDVKLELISLLSASLTPSSKDISKESWAHKYCGAWKDEGSPQDMARHIRESRYLRERDIIQLD